MTGNGIVALIILALVIGSVPAMRTGMIPEVQTIRAAVSGEIAALWPSIQPDPVPVTRASTGT
ncbi:MAG TPA: hypothetical protein PKA20_18420 [Burkholderiaceae bacterium]|nr:hypothetical protein [Burkholderiaceae bacterium]